MNPIRCEVLPHPADVFGFQHAAVPTCVALCCLSRPRPPTSTTSADSTLRPFIYCCCAACYALHRPMFCQRPNHISVLLLLASIGLGATDDAGPFFTRMWCHPVSTAAPEGARGLLEGFDRSFPKHGARAMSGWACPGRRGSITVTYLPPSAPLSTVLNGPN